MVIDPPEGWKYGFPKSLPETYHLPDFNLKEWLLEQGYPEDMLDLALKYSRYWGGNNGRFNDENN